MFFRTTDGAVDQAYQTIRRCRNPGVLVRSVGTCPGTDADQQTRGGHMRLITGYDMEKKVIYFSDSWGSEHTCKEMPIDNAAAITICRLVVMPTK